MDDNVMLMTGHERAFWNQPMSYAYDYDPAADGPEVEAITRILARQPLYIPGKEGELLKFQAFVDAVARKMYGKRYDVLGKRRKESVRYRVIFLHVAGGKRRSAVWRPE